MMGAVAETEAAVVATDAPATEAATEAAAATEAVAETEAAVVATDAPAGGCAGDLQTRTRLAAPAWCGS